MDDRLVKSPLHAGATDISERMASALTCGFIVHLVGLIADGMMLIRVGVKKN